MKLTTLIILTFATAAFGTSAEATCFDVSRGEPSHLSGHLTHRMFAGAPNFTDVQKGDTPEPGYILKLAKPICLTGDDDFADSANKFDEVQVVATDDVEKTMERFRDTDVNVDLIEPMPAMTGHHHRPLVAWVKAISSARDITESYGTAATVVDAFYAALRSGDGAIAATFVVPEKTANGAYAPKALTAFYGALSEPLTLIDIQPIDPSHFSVRYHFRSGTKTCDGAATVTTVNRDGRNFIQRIDTANGC